MRPIAIAAALFCSAAFAPPVNAQEARPVSIKGYDPVAYFSEGRPVKGLPQFEKDWDGARYHFANARHQDAFSAHPDRYAPQFSGLCAAAMSYGKTFEADPTVWKIVDGRLYVFKDKKGLERLENDPELLRRAHGNFKSRR